ncbi:MAG: 4Fe-4S double cluster binding domain-containing protein [Chloroflexota bacterium]
MSLSSDVKRVALEEGADLVGVAGVDAFEQAPEGCRPWDILPGAKAIVVAAKHVPRGVMQSPNLRVYRSSARFIEEELTGVSHQVAYYLESRGYLASPVQPDIPIDMERSVPILGDLSHKHAAAEAGLGIIGASSLLITPQFGPRLRLVSVVTDAPLEPGCKLDVDFCRACSACLEACPAGAIQKVGGLDKGKCIRGCMPHSVGGLLKFIREFMEIEDREERVKKLRDPRLFDFHQYLRTGGYTCARCVKICPVGK